MTLEEIEDNGEFSLPTNKARVEIDRIRKRKGIMTDEKIVVDAEK
jgi:hypothetical protein